VGDKLLIGRRAAGYDIVNRLKVDGAPTPGTTVGIVLKTDSDPTTKMSTAKPIPTAEEAAALLCPADGGAALLATGRSATRDMIADILRDLQLEAAGKKPAAKPLWIEYKMGADGTVVKKEKWD
jgi:hypothetical protein